MDLLIVGAGLIIPDQFTIEGLEALCSSKVVFSVYHPKELVEATIEWYCEKTRSENSRTQVISADEFYYQDRVRESNYEIVANKIIESIEKYGTPICYLTQGNPFNFDKVSSLLIQIAQKKNYSFEVISGVSSIDTIMTDLRKDVAPGLQIFEASCFVGQEIRPDIRFSCLLLQISSFGTNFSTKNRMFDKNNLWKLREYLSSFYPKSHEVSLVRSKTNPDILGKMLSIELENLDKIDISELLGSSLFIPPLTNPKMSDDFLSQMNDIKHLNEVYPLKI
jgi:uncharacterized protein YabN with tetrapyrrole methylase and pyrophosphatase domain